jgi:hypothetical protein
LYEENKELANAPGAQRCGVGRYEMLAAQATRRNEIFRNPPWATTQNTNPTIIIQGIFHYDPPYSLHLTINPSQLLSAGPARQTTFSPCSR